MDLGRLFDDPDPTYALFVEEVADTVQRRRIELRERERSAHG